MIPDIRVNGRVFGHQVAGIRRYADQLIKRMGPEVTVCQPKRRLSGVRGHMWEQFTLPSLLDGGVLWSPSSTGPLRVTDQVVTIHDVAFLEHPEWFSRSFAAWYSWLVPRLVRKVARVIAVSHFTENRLRELTDVGKGVSVVWSGVDEAFAPQSTDAVAAMRDSLGIGSSPYLLALGTFEPRKNLRRVLTAWARVPRAVRGECKLVLAGAPGSRTVFSEAGVEDRPEDVHVLGFVPDSLLPALYTGARAFVYASLYEGFGLPPLEAAACETASVISDRTAMPEVLADAALQVDPYDVEAIAGALHDVLVDDALVKEVSTRARERSLLFSWESTARQTREVLAEVST